MHTVDLLAEALAVAKRLGFRIRQEWLGGTGGVCELKGQRWIFLDDALSPAEQLGIVLDALREDPALHLLPLEGDLARAVNARKAA